jgi:hypothetical protein
LAQRQTRRTGAPDGAEGAVPRSPAVGRDAASLAAARTRRLEQGFVIAAGLAAGAGVLVAGWPPLLVLALFWVENLVVAAFQVARMLLLGARDGWAGLYGCAVVALIFAAWSVLFWLAHAALIVGVVGDGYEPTVGLPIESALLLVERLRDTAEIWPVLGLMLVVAVLDLLRWLFTAQADPLGDDIGAMMKAATSRMAVLQGSLLLGGFVLNFFAAPQAVVLLLVVLKFAVELQALRGQ